MSETDNTEIIELEILGLESHINANAFSNDLEKYWIIGAILLFSRKNKNLDSVLG